MSAEDKTRRMKKQEIRSARIWILVIIYIVALMTVATCVGVCG